MENRSSDVDYHNNSIDMSFFFIGLPLIFDKHHELEKHVNFRCFLF